MTPAYRIDDAPAARERFYELACDPQRSVVVEACAGAGKTWMLVARILRALLDGTPPEAILAITFTRKAAGEMRRRLDELLIELGPGASEADRIRALEQRGMPPDEARRRSAELEGLHRRLLDLPRGVEVRTFHAWFAQLTTQLPLALRRQLGLPAEPQLLEEPTPLRPLLWRRFLRAVDADAALADDFRVLVARHRRSAVDAWLDAAWRRGDELDRADAAGVLETSMPGAEALDARCAAGQDPSTLMLQGAFQALVRESMAELGRASGVKPAEARDKLGRALEHLATGSLDAAFVAAWDALFTKTDAQPRKGVEGPSATPALRDELTTLGELRHQHEARDDHLRLVRLARCQRRLWAELKLELSLADMGDLERAALALLGDPAAAGWVQQRLDLRYRQVLIDEFQDTSPVQWHALAGWLSAYSGAGGGASGQQPPALFIVGDPKQSIYRFRRAEPRVFEAAGRLVVDGFAGHRLACDHTWRNAPAVLAAVNHVFGEASRDDGWTPFRPHTTQSDHEGRVAALPLVPRAPREPANDAPPVWRDSLTVPRLEIEEHRRDVEARGVAAAVAHAIANEGVPPGEVMVLARRRVALGRVAAALAALGVPHALPEALDLSAQPAVQDLVALLDVLVSPGHDLSLARALRSPLLGCSDDDLLALSRHARACGEAWLEALPGVPEPSASLQRASARLAGWRALARGLGPHELLDRIGHDTDAEARLLAALPMPRRAAARQALHSLMRAALEFDAGRYVSTYRFVHALRQGRIPSPEVAPEQAVRLLTIHGAKGLEADRVFLVDALPENTRAASSTLLVDWPVESGQPLRCAFVRSESRLPAALQPLMARERAERDREELNGLYVALTRARAQIVVSASEAHRASPARSWWERLQATAMAIEVPPAAAPWRDEGGDAFDLPRLPAAPPGEPGDAGAGADADADADAETRAAALGRAVHRLLEWIGQPGPAALPRPRWPSAAAQAASAFGLDKSGADEVLKLASRIADSPECRRFFAGPALRWAGAEVPVAWAGESLRIDRLVQLDESEGPAWWVLDYKLAHRPEALQPLREQLARYRDAVQQAQHAAGDRRPVHAAFVTGQGHLVPL